MRSLLLFLFFITAHNLLFAQDDIFPGEDDQTPSKSEYISWINNTNERETEDLILAKVDSVIQLMTLEEKAGQLNHLSSNYSTDIYTRTGGLSKQIQAGRVGAITPFSPIDTLIEFQRLALEQSRLSIPLLFAGDVVHGYRTIFPVPIAQSCSWDMEAIENAERIAAIEASASGLNWTFAPNVDISRDPRWGRVMEGSGEDPYLGSRIAKSRIRGFQGSNLADGNSIMATLKHFAAYGAAEGGREYNTVDVSERELREVYLPPFQAGVDAGAASIMNAFNIVDRIPASASHFLMTTIARGEWGFNGFFVSDAFSYYELVPFGFATDRCDAAMKSFNAGGDMDLWSEIFIENLPRLVKEGKVNEQMVDDAVRRILFYKFKLGLFDDPYRYLNQNRKDTTLFKNEFQEASRDLARKSIVLLKNENDILPIKDKVQKIALIGPLANTRERRNYIGNWSMDYKEEDIITLFDGLKKLYPQSEIIHETGCNPFGDCPKHMISKAVTASQSADIIILAIGEDGYMSGECASRADISLPGNQEDLIDALSKTGKPLVAVIFGGRPMVLTPVIDQLDAVLYAWQPGTLGGLAIADLLSGSFNPSAKLTMTFPRHQGQIPIYYNELPVGRPRLGPEDDRWGISKWSDELNEPLFPFGFGLSYTQFEYSNLSLSENFISLNDSILVSVDLKNTGNFDGEEIVQLYVRDLVGSVVRPLKELKGFDRVLIKKGEKRTVQFVLRATDLAFYNQDMELKTEVGEFIIMVGGSSDDYLEAGFEIY